MLKKTERTFTFHQPQVFACDPMEAQTQESLTHNGQPITSREILDGGEFETVKGWFDCAEKVLKADNNLHMPDGVNDFFFAALQHYCVDWRAPLNWSLQDALWQRFIDLDPKFSSGMSDDQADREALKTANLINDHIIYCRLSED